MRELVDELKAIPAGWQRRLSFMGHLTERLAPLGLRPIVVGGNAVEFYTLGGYATGDIDIVFPDHQEIDRCLTDLGFVRSGRHWLNAELDLAIECPGSVLSGDPSMVTEVDVEGKSVFIIGIEDLIIDRLNALVHWKSERDGEWADNLLALHHETIDFDYLEKRAVEEGTLEALQERLRTISRETDFSR